MKYSGCPKYFEGAGGAAVRGQGAKSWRGTDKEANYGLHALSRARIVRRE